VREGTLFSNIADFHCFPYRHSFRNEQGSTEETEATLNDDDKVWVDVRHMHMKEALDTLVAAFRQFNQEHGGPGGSSINDLKDMLANLPGMKESKEKVRKQAVCHAD
jgi:syntaxin-binding protein 1